MGTFAENFQASDAAALRFRGGVEPDPARENGRAPAPERHATPALRRVLVVCGLAALLGAAYGVGRLEGEVARERVAEHAASKAEKYSNELRELRAAAAAGRARTRLLEARRQLHRASLALVAHNFGTARERLSLVARELGRPDVAPELAALGSELGDFEPAVLADVAADRQHLDALAERFDGALDSGE